MLKQRVCTAVVLAGVLLAALFGLSATGFSTFMTVFLGYAAWEWSALAGLVSRAARIGFVAGILQLSVLIVWAQAGFGGSVSLVLALACSGWLIALRWICRYPQSAIHWGRVGICLVMGVWVLVPTWVSIHFLVHEGVLMVLWVVLIVAAADIGAYFCGRRFGRHQLAPAVSPGKTWEGVAGGQLFVLPVALASGWYLGLSGELWVGWLVLAALAGLASVVGDLLESMVKRHRGVKDSGCLLPGHGGLLDRIDGLTAALPVFALSFTLLHPRI